MNTNLIELKSNELLEKFGAGNHKPGSGSAAAFQGMLSAQMIRTVSTLTCERPNYKGLHESFTGYLAEVDENIYPRLERLFQEDSVQFGKVFDARVSRDKAKGSKVYAKLVEQARNELIPATEIPLEIGKHCSRLAEIAIVAFESGFQAARGDTAVALNGALSAVAGCLSIVDLNLLSFGSNNWTAKIRAEATQLKNKYTSLSERAAACSDQLRSEADKIAEFYEEFEAFKQEAKHRKITSNADIEKIARQLQGAMWKNHKLIWKKKAPDDPIELLKPQLAIQLLGYDFDSRISLGQHEIDGSMYEVAGQIDNEQKTILISSQYSPAVRNFTAAHELGHALLHQQQLLHRDRPLDGSGFASLRDDTERQADKFATYFLMPKQIVKDRFKENFLADQFVISEKTAFALNFSGVRELRDKASNKDGLTRILASTGFYNGTKIRSLGEQFGVSIEAMAIRLGELDLVEWG